MLESVCTPWSPFVPPTATTDMTSSNHAGLREKSLYHLMTLSTASDLDFDLHCKCTLYMYTLTRSVVLSSTQAFHTQILSRSPIFLHGCEIKSGRGRPGYEVTVVHHSCFSFDIHVHVCIYIPPQE